MMSVLKKAFTIYLYTAVPVAIVTTIIGIRKHYFRRRNAMLAQEPLAQISYWQYALMTFIYGFGYIITFPTVGIIEYRSRNKCC